MDRVHLFQRNCDLEFSILHKSGVQSEDLYILVIREVDQVCEVVGKCGVVV